MAQPAPERGERTAGTPRPRSAAPTMLKALLRERHWQNYGLFKRAYQKAAKGLDKDLVETYPSRATLHRWMTGQVKKLPYPEHCAVLEAMLPGWTAAELFTPYVAPDNVDGSTLLRELLRRRCLHNYREFCRAYDIAAAAIDTQLVGGYPAEQQFHRWICGETGELPHPGHCTVLEAMFLGYSARQLFEITEPPEPARPDQPDSATKGTVAHAPAGIGLRLPDDLPTWSAVTGCRLSDPVAVPLGRHNGVVTARGTARTDTEGQVIAMSADRARDFLTRIEATNVGAETLDQLFDDLRHLIIAYLQQPLPTLLGDLVDTQERAFALLEGHQRPDQTRDLYLVAGVTCGLMASASKELGAAHDAMTQARTAYACADNAGHDGLRAWIRGLQVNIAYWAERWEDAVRYAQLGAEVAARTRSTAGVFLASGEARAWGALNRLENARAAVARASEGWDRVQPDDLDALGGLCTYIRPVQLIYAAQALSWGGAPEAPQVEQLVLEALEGFPVAFPGGSFRNEAGARCALAVARVTRREVDGATEALAPVLALPAPQRDHTIVTAVERVRTALSAVTDPSRGIVDLAEAIETFTTERLVLPN
ncbi:MAG: hypothetical protein ACRDTE_33850 [Pseudonocardiaceae bacterium]